MQPDAVNGGDPHLARHNMPEFLHPPLDAGIALQNLLAVVVKNFPAICQTEVLAAALDEQRFEMLFQGLDRLADGRLADAVQLSGLGEASCFCQIAEYLEAFKLHTGIE